MCNIKKSLGACTLLFLGVSVAISQLPNPRELLTKSDEALSSLHAISYRAEFYVVGTLKYGDQDAILTPSQGEVLFVRAAEDKYLGGKLVVQGEKPRTRTDGKHSYIKVVYDRQKVWKLIQDEKVVYVNDPDQAGMYLLHDVADLIPQIFRGQKLTEKMAEAQNISYAGLAVVNGISCHIIHLEFSGESFPKESWLSLGIDDYLPRRIQEVGYGLPRQEIMRVLTLAEVKMNPPIDPAQFALDAPEAFAVKSYQLSREKFLTLAEGTQAPDWLLKDVNNKEYSLKDIRGKILILDFWATWCGPCRQAMPYLQKLHEKYGKKGVVVVGISTWETGDPMKFMQEKGYSYMLLLGNNEVAKNYQVSGIPTLYLISPDGKILFGEVGFESDGGTSFLKLDAKIQELIAKRSK